MRSYFLVHFQAFVRAVKRLAFQPASSLLSVIVIGIALTLPIGLYAFLENVIHATSHLNTDPHINIYLTVGANEEDARAVEARLVSNPLLQSVKFVSRDEALKEMQTNTHLAELLANLDTNPLPHAFTVRPKSLTALEELRKQIAAIPKVEFVLMDFEWAQKLTRFVDFAQRLVAMLALLLAGAVVFVTGNTIRLQILTQRDEIEVSRLIGATQSFIRRPFLYFGALQGLSAGLVALLISLVTMWWVTQNVQALTISYASDFSVLQLSFERSFWILLSATALGWLGAFLSVTLYFRQLTGAKVSGTN